MWDLVRLRWYRLRASSFPMVELCFLRDEARLPAEVLGAGSLGDWNRVSIKNSSSCMCLGGLPRPLRLWLCQPSHRDRRPSSGGQSPDILQPRGIHRKTPQALDESNCDNAKPSVNGVLRAGSNPGRFLPASHRRTQKQAALDTTERTRALRKPTNQQTEARVVFRRYQAILQNECLTVEAGDAPEVAVRAGRPARSRPAREGPAKAPRWVMTELVKTRWCS
jgi:hypothetical protein